MPEVLFSPLSLDDISALIDEAKNKAATANDTASNTMNRLDDIQKEIDKIKVTPGDSNLNNVLNEVNKTGESLNHSFLYLIINSLFIYFCPLKVGNC